MNIDAMYYFGNFLECPWRTFGQCSDMRRCIAQRHSYCTLATFPRYYGNVGGMFPGDSEGTVTFATYSPHTRQSHSIHIAGIMGGCPHLYGTTSKRCVRDIRVPLGGNAYGRSMLPHSPHGTFLRHSQHIAGMLGL